MGLLDVNYPQTEPPGLFSPGPVTAMAPGQQKWLDALAAVSAGLKDAGAYLQHNPAAAGNVAAFVRQRAGLQSANGVPSMPSNLSPAVLAALLLHAAQQNPAIVAQPSQTSSQPGAVGSAPAQMLQAGAPQSANQTQTSQTMPAQNPGWAVQKVR